MRFRNDIQGLRAIAVLSVVLYHAKLSYVPGGYMGVDVFFVISGFLITSHLATGSETATGIRLADFYAKRVRRILPASFVVIVLSLVGATLVVPVLQLGQITDSALWTALYVPNYYFAIEGTNYLAEDTPSLFQHYWSLGVEEQFYLLWPLIVVLLMRRVRRRLGVAIALGLLVGLSFAASVYLTALSQPWAFFSLDTRAWELGVGGLLALALAPKGDAAPSRQAWHPSANFGAVLGWLGVAGILASVTLGSDSLLFPGWWAAIPVLSSVAVIAGGAVESSWGPARVLALRPLVFVGLISYSLYLVHWPALQFAQMVRPNISVAALLLIAAACVPLAWLLLTFVEDPIRTSTRLRAAPSKRSLQLAAFGTAATLLVVGGFSLYAHNVALYVDREAPVAAVTPLPAGTDFVPKNLQPSLRAGSDDLPALYRDGCQVKWTETDPSGCLYGPSDAPTIALFGDSHAAAWFSGVYGYARSHGYAVRVFAKASCPAYEVEMKYNGRQFHECDTWRAGVIDNINSGDFAMVIATGFYRPSTMMAPRGTKLQAWHDGIVALGSKIDKPMVLLADTPNMDETPSICLSANLDDASACSVPRDTAISASLMSSEQEAAAQAGLSLVDMNDYFCNETTCPAIIGNTLVYRDSHHMTNVFSAEMAAPLSKELPEIEP